MNKPLFLALLMLGALANTGCVSQVARPVQYSGFLTDYSQLKEVTTPSGHQTLRFVDDNFKPQDYDTAQFGTVELYPQPQPTDRASLDTLVKLQQYTSSLVKSVLGLRYTVIDASANGGAAPAGPRTVQMKVAITRVDASNVGMQWYEAVPVAGAIGAIAAVSGHRDQTPALYIEATLVDSTTHQALVSVVRKVMGQPVKNAAQPITVEDFKVALKDVSSDMVTLLR